MPMPVSSITSSIYPSSSGLQREERRITPPAGVYFTAFSRKIRSICRIVTLSASTMAGSFAKSCKWWLSTAICIFLNTSPTSACISRSSLCRICRFWSARARNKSFSISSCMFSASEPMASSPSCKVSSSCLPQRLSISA